MIRALIVNSSGVLAVAADPISAIMNRDWASASGWSLFIGLVMTITVGSFREWWVPGGRYRRLEESSIELQKSNTLLLSQNEELIKANEITKYFFEATTPKRGGKKRDLEQES